MLEDFLKHKKYKIEINNEFYTDQQKKIVDLVGKIIDENYDEIINTLSQYNDEIYYEDIYDLIEDTLDLCSEELKGPTELEFFQDFSVKDFIPVKLGYYEPKKIGKNVYAMKITQKGKRLRKNYFDIINRNSDN